MTSKVFHLIALAVCTGALPVVGQLPVSRPGGVIVTTIKGAGGFTGISVPFTREPVARAVVSSVAGNTINAAGTPFIGADYTSVPHSVHIVSGPNRGRTIRIASKTDSSVTLTAPPPALVNNVDEFEVVPEWTLGNTFGTGPNPSGLASNTVSANADIVYLAEGGSLVQYFHNGSNWRRVATPANANNVTLGGLNGGCLILKRSAGDLTFSLNGTVRSGRTDVTVPQGFSIVTYTDVAGATLGTSGLVPSVIASNPLSSSADIVYLTDATGQLVQYFHNGTIWRRVATPANANATPLRPESALIINKRSAGTAQWLINESFAP